MEFLGDIFFIIGGILIIIASIMTLRKAKRWEERYQKMREEEDRKARNWARRNRGRY